jgi:hypothetical protein
MEGGGKGRPVSWIEAFIAFVTIPVIIQLWQEDPLRKG